MPRSQVSKQKLKDIKINWWAAGPLLAATVLLLLNITWILGTENGSMSFLTVPVALLILAAILFNEDIKKADWKAIGSWLVVTGPTVLLMVILAAGLSAGFIWILLSGVE